MALLHGKNNKHIDIDANSILLLTQGIIEVAVLDKDESFFATDYGKSIIDAYNTALTIHTRHDYEITAEFILDKMRKGEIVFDTEEYRRTV